MHQIPEFCVRRPVTTMMAFLMVVLLGVVSYFKLPMQLLPDVSLPTVGVFAQRSSSAEDNLDTLTRPLESLVAEMPNVRRIRSWTRQDRIWIQVEFNFGTDLKFATIDLEDRLNTFREDLDDRRVFINAFPFSTAEFIASYMFLSVRGPGDVESLFDIAQDKIEQQLKAINGVAEVEIQGTFADSAEVRLDTERLIAYGLDFGQVIQRINSSANEDTYLGSLDVPGETHFVRLDDRVKNIKELRDIVVDNRGLVKLADIAEVELGEAVDSFVFRADGKNAIGIELQKEDTANMIELARKTRTAITEINATLPPGVEIVVDEDLAKYVEDAISQVKRLALEGALLSLLVPLFFFRSLRLSMIVMLAVPICLVAVFNLFLWADMSINIFSIIGLAIGVGMVVDNSIVVCENSFRLHSQMKAPPAEAAAHGAGQVSKALLASTATSGIVFLPLAFLDSEFRYFAREPVLALVFPLLISYAVAVTLCPVLVFMLLKAGGVRSLDEGGARIVELYRLPLKWGIRHRGSLILLIAGVIAFTLFESFVTLRQETTSRDSNGDFVRVFVRVPQGSTLSDVNRTMVYVEEKLAGMQDVKRFSVAFNSSDGRVNIILKEVGERPSGRSTDEFRSRIVEELGTPPYGAFSLNRQDVPIASSQLTLGDRGSIEIKGLDRRAIDPYLERLVDALLTLPEITGAREQEEDSDPVYQVRIDRERSRLLGITSQTLAQYVGATRSSGTLSQLQLKDGDKRTNVAIVIEEVEGDTVENTKDMQMFSQVAGFSRLGDVTTFRPSQVDTRILRINRQSAVDLEYFVRPGVDRPALDEKVKQLVRSLPNPGGIVAEVAGDAAKIDERMANLGFLVVAGTLLVYICMAAVFESFWVPLVIVLMITLVPLGMKWGLAVFDLPFEDMAVLGFLLLIGLVVNSGIVMMDRTLELQRLGYSRMRAVFTASSSRLRPVLMTYLTTILGLLPMALKGTDESQWRPVAVVIIGGSTSSTLVTLLALPAFYLIGDDFVRWTRPAFLRGLAAGFLGAEFVVNTATNGVAALVAFWRWRPLSWPRRVWGALRAAPGFAARGARA
ncbi:MAG: efflux RND transporter permease subunit, partial [Candidatus Sumerlaeia bacterium]|nr:efflux RND transporter permease subunit [Candidatus Sumerlaeia bacterium]